MSNRLNVIGSSPMVLGFIVIVLINTGMARAQLSLKAVGEVASASLTTMNGSPVTSGTTVFSKNRIRTEKEGKAIINLGRLGRIEFGSETDVTLNVTAGGIGGELHSGRLVVSARAGVAVAINSAKGLVRASGREASVLTIDLDSKRDLVIAHQGRARMISGESDAAAITGGARPSSLGANSGAASTSSSVSMSMLNAGVTYSVMQLTSRDFGAAKSFETGMTCRDRGNNLCENRSKFKP